MWKNVEKCVKMWKNVLETRFLYTTIRSMVKQLLQHNSEVWGVKAVFTVSGNVL